jgi:hypothetical protein
MCIYLLASRPTVQVTIMGPEETFDIGAGFSEFSDNNILLAASTHNDLRFSVIVPQLKAQHFVNIYVIAESAPQ